MQNARSLVVLALITLAGAGVASAAAVDLDDGGDLHEGIGQSDLRTKLQPGSTYTASKFPVALKIRPPDPLWGGVQHESGNYRFVQLGHQHLSGTAPLTGVGYITLESAKDAPPTGAQ